MFLRLVFLAHFCVRVNSPVCSVKLQKTFANLIRKNRLIAHNFAPKRPKFMRQSLFLRNNFAQNATGLILLSPAHDWACAARRTPAQRKKLYSPLLRLRRPRCGGVYAPLSCISFFAALLCAPRFATPTHRPFFCSLRLRKKTFFLLTSGAMAPCRKRWANCNYYISVMLSTTRML